MLYSGAAASLQGLIECNENFDDEGDDNDDEEDESDDDDNFDNDDDDDDDAMLAWWKQPLKEFSLTSISP